MTPGSLRLKLKLLIFTSIGAGIVSTVSGGKFAFVWYNISMICVVAVVLAWSLIELVQTRR